VEAEGRQIDLSARVGHQLWPTSRVERSRSAIHEDSSQAEAAAKAVSTQRNPIQRNPILGNGFPFEQLSRTLSYCLPSTRLVAEIGFSIRYECEVRRHRICVFWHAVDRLRARFRAEIGEGAERGELSAGEEIGVVSRDTLWA
jgi:hypothetical protein